jgi:hypothetical protein
MFFGLLVILLDLVEALRFLLLGITLKSKIPLGADAPYITALKGHDVRCNWDKNMGASSSLLTFLDLYHFPLRGEEQAEFMAERISELKRIYTSGS